MYKDRLAYDCKCCKCGHSWLTRTAKLPKVCPKCVRVTWNDDDPISGKLRRLGQILDKDELEVVSKALGKPLVETVGQDPPATELERLIVEDLITPAVKPADQRAVLDQLKGYMAGKVPAEAITVLPEADVSTVEEEPDQMNDRVNEIYGDAPTSLSDLPDNAPETPKIVLATPPDPRFGELDVVTEGLDQTRHW